MSKKLLGLLLIAALVLAACPTAAQESEGNMTIWNPEVASAAMGFKESAALTVCQGDLAVCKGNSEEVAADLGSCQAALAACQNNGQQEADDSCKDKDTPECVCPKVIFSTPDDPTFGCKVAAALDKAMPRTATSVAKRLATKDDKDKKKYNKKLLAIVKNQAWATLDYWFDSSEDFDALFGTGKPDPEKVDPEAIVEAVLKKTANGLDILALGHDIPSIATLPPTEPPKNPGDDKGKKGEDDETTNDKDKPTGMVTVLDGGEEVCPPGSIHK